MGQAKYNQTAIDAKAGLLPPKPKRMGAAEQRKIIQRSMLNSRYGLIAGIGMVKDFPDEVYEGIQPPPGYEFDKGKPNND